MSRERRGVLEPVSENEGALKALCNQLPSAEYLLVAASNYVGSGELKVSDDATYSHLIGAGDARPHLYSYRSINTVTIDHVIKLNAYEPPFCVKVDVDGRELEVLAGCISLQSPENVFVVEATFVNRQPSFRRLIDFIGYIRFSQSSETTLVR